MDVFLHARPLGWSKFKVIHRQFGFMSTWTSQNHPFGLRPFRRPCTVDLDASKYASYGDFAEWMDFAHLWSFIGKGLHLQPAQQACFNKLNKEEI